jgi:hypothetical protein
LLIKAQNQFIIVIVSVITLFKVLFASFLAASVNILSEPIFLQTGAVGLRISW